LTGATPASTSSTGLTGATPTPTTGIGLTGSPPPAASPAALDLEESTLRVHWQGRTVELTAVEFSLLATLYASPGRIFSRNRLMALIYRDHRVVSDRTIDSHIKKLRRKLEELSTDQEWVHSVYGVGYRYEEQD
jgi:two-component system response regulator BaeR